MFNIMNRFAMWINYVSNLLVLLSDGKLQNIEIEESFYRARHISTLNYNTLLYEGVTIHITEKGKYQVYTGFETSSLHSMCEYIESSM